METFYNILLVIAAIIAVVFSLLIFFTGKGDAMSGGGGAVRTSFKGKASFDDQIFRVTLMLGGSFLVAMVVLDMLAARIWK
jgi:preprotein translocase subunit SecG